MAVLINRSYLQASTSLATDLARYGSAAIWRGVYYRGEKIGFTVSQTVPTDDGFELRGGRPAADVAARRDDRARRSTPPRTSTRRSRCTPSSSRSIPGPVRSRSAAASTAAACRSRSRRRAAPAREVRELDEPPALSLNISRRLANGGLVAGAQYQWTVFDPATLRNSPVNVEVGRRELVRGAGAAPLPAFRVEMEFAGLKTSSWITDTGEVVREESPLGLITVRESAESARAMAVSRRMQVDLLQAAAVAPRMTDADRRAARRAPDAHPPRRRRSVRRSISTAARSACAATSSSCAIRRR